jgi:hypothetical protein
MTKRKLLFISLLLPAMLTGVFSGRAEILGRGPYHGYFTVTRWGHKVLHLGPYHLFVSDSAAHGLEEHRGKPLEVEVSKLSQPINPGAGLIDGIAKVSEKGVARGLILSVELTSKKAVQGKGIVLTLSLQNDSGKAITIWPGTLAIALVTDSPFSNRDIGYKDPDDCAYWYYSYAYHSLEKGKKPMRVACRRIMLPWTAEDLVTQGKGIRVADKDRAFRGPIEIDSEGRFESEYVVGKELLPDDYEVFFYLTSGNFSSVPGPMSNRLPFDIVRREQEDEPAEQPPERDK